MIDFNHDPRAADALRFLFGTLDNAEGSQKVNIESPAQYGWHLLPLYSIVIDLISSRMTVLRWAEGDGLESSASIAILMCRE